MNVAQAITKILIAEGVEVAAGITGASVAHIADSLVQAPEVFLCYTRSERVAVDVCDGYARVSGKPGVVFTDHGPGAANTMAGILNSYGDSVPLLFLAGQNRRFEVPKRAQKELPIEVFRPISNWTATITDPSQVEHIMRRAFVALRSGRPGPVVVGIPYDLAHLEAPEFTYQPAPPPMRCAGDPRAVEDAVRLLASAQRPYVCAGAGVLISDATSELVELAELLTLPVGTTLNGKSAFPENHPLSVGKGGVTRATHATHHATQTAREADLILAVGCSFQRHAFLDPIPAEAKLIQVDINAPELSKEAPSDIAILGDAKLVLRQMADAARALAPASRLEPRREVLDKLAQGRQAWMDYSMPFLTSAETPINPFRVTWELSQLVDPDQTIVLHDAGGVRGVVSQHYTATAPRSFLGYGVQSAMGWSLGAAMGARLAAPDKLAVAFIGDEAFGETAFDMETAVSSGIPVLLVLINNRADTRDPENSMVRQALVRPVGDYCGVARALGFWAEQVQDPDLLRGTLARAIDAVKGGQPALVEVLTKRVPTASSRMVPAAAR